MDDGKKPETAQGSDIEASIGRQSDEKVPSPQGDAPTFPEGGLRAWSVALGSSGVLFSTFGYVNAFGYVSPLKLILKT